MFELATAARKCTVTRSLSLPKAGPLPAQSIESTFEVTYDLAGADPKSGPGKEVLEMFHNTYLTELRLRGTRQDKEFEARWQALGKELAGAKSRDAAEKAAAAFEKDVLADWNDFAQKDGKRHAESLFAYAVKEVAKKHGDALAKARVAFKADELKPARVGILSSILSALTLGAASGGLGWAAFAIGGMVALLKGYQGAWEIARARATDVQANLNQIDDTLGKVAKAMEALEGRTKAMQQGRNVLEAELMKGAAELAKMQKVLADLEARAKKDAAVRDGRYLAEVRAQVEDGGAGLADLRKRIGDLDRLDAAIRAARTAVVQASDLSTAERRGWDATMVRFAKVSSDTTTALGAVATLLKAIKAAV